MFRHLVLTALALLGPTTAAPAAEQILDTPVSFTVRNVNRSALACPADGRTYTVRGHLTAPRSALRGDGHTVTLYQHGIAGGEWYWRLNVPGYDHAREMAERGHASVTIDRIGYDSSDAPDGYTTCIGAQADITHQIGQQLRAGGYRLGGGRTAPAFDRLVLAGQSNGGLIANLAVISFGGFDALSVHGWGDLGFTPQADRRFWDATARCIRGAASGERGYVYYDVGSTDFLDGNFADADPRVRDAVVPLQNPHPCGDMTSITAGIYTDLRRLGEIRVPVLVVYGERDARIQNGELQRSLYKGSPDADLVTVPAAGHYMGLERNARTVHDAMASWLAGLP
ncbi:alpha/beta hydrolase [Phytohabitans houttuyneae]|uniref:Alpha/beta hydrolase n=1 Tax=Phytohabitans houttuyneae TaxID=1076126 RepID=A0A6V8JUZ1_9ACTN|nr:alpha/beta hydrolase [Phytohabitans houttuyneae]GFJ76423.1 alpha/beta hydrolase [Phytohabitans houttuyneae]